DIADLSRRAAKNANLDVEVLGPAPAPLARLRGRYRFRVLLRAKDRAALRRVLLLVDQSFSRVDRRVRAVIDVDPVAML
ncbi:MAG: hypothetical protein U0271_16520, partial [Polyangiaceae bacterium]